MRLIFDAFSQVISLSLRNQSDKMRTVYYSILMLLVMTSGLSAQDLTSGVAPYKYLLGTFKVTVYLPDGNGDWNAGGGGTADFITTLSGTFIEENIATSIGSSTLTMKNTIGVDGRSKNLRLIAMDKEYSTMDVYHGKSDNKTLVFTNLKSDEAFETQNGESLSFRLTYRQLSASKNSLLVEFTKDKGKNWSPYARQEYLRK
ncbi:MAG: DUF1579 family protein [Roseivirga sp.]|nr:DUF1579 family protein [Roseivirga sp.]